MSPVQAYDPNGNLVGGDTGGGPATSLDTDTSPVVINTNHPTAANQVLKSTSPTNATWQSSYIPNQTFTFLQNSGTYTVPANVVYLTVTCVGGGGGGGGSSNGTSSDAGGGGGGGLCYGIIPPTLASTYAYSVGSGGSGTTGPSSSNGGNGGDTTFTCGSGNFNGKGGSGGTSSTSASSNGAGGAGGVPTNTSGFTNVKLLNGQVGSDGAFLSAAIGFGGQGGGSPIFSSGGVGYNSGNGRLVGGEAGVFGGGGAGARNNGNSAAGGSGYIIITEHY